MTLFGANIEYITYSLNIFLWFDRRSQPMLKMHEASFVDKQRFVAEDGIQMMQEGMLPFLFPLIFNDFVHLLVAHRQVVEIGEIPFFQSLPRNLID